jgi:hypothetical protein
MSGANFGTQPLPGSSPGVTMRGGGGSPPRTEEQLVGILINALSDCNEQGIDTNKVLGDHGVLFTDPHNPVINVRRRGLRIVGTAYDISRVLEACKNAMDWIEHNGGGLNDPVTVAIHPPQEDEP